MYFFHKSIADWLVDLAEKKSSGDFYTDAAAGHAQIAACAAESIKAATAAIYSKVQPRGSKKPTVTTAEITAAFRRVSDYDMRYAIAHACLGIDYQEGVYVVELSK